MQKAQKALKSIKKNFITYYLMIFLYDMTCGL